MLLDQPDFFNYTFGNPAILEKGVHPSGLFLDDLSFILETCNDLREALPKRYNKRFKYGINRDNILAFLYIF